MRNLFFLTFLSLVACQSNEAGSSQNVPKDLRSLHQEVLAIHDEVMPKMSLLTGLQALLGDKLKELRSIQPVEVEKLKEANQVLGQLNRSESAMWDWMDGFSKFDSIPAEEKEVFLLNEKASAEDMKTLMLNSIKAAEEFIVQNPIQVPNEGN
ncbi:MAG: hypothetical protein IPL46_20900 [Saprospiraceae bacterium]|nr:hypothetical protein [Saprospiraceae bacterium]